MPLTPGTRIGPYEILAPLGAGGMGEVYRARDSRLGREVAVKTLPETLTGEPERLARLHREAQLLATLNHPHIASIYGLETIAGAHFLALELVDGESLADIISRGRLPFQESLAIVRQIVDAVEAAHDKGIVHRDLKPANVMLTHEGQVKVLDFGLARAIEGDAVSNVTNSPTLSFAATQTGVILGTAAYMSPEQAKGRVADKRSDVWAFGCIWFEMVTGQRAFDGEDASDILAGILRGEPDWSALPSDVPEETKTLIRRCVEKDRRARIPDMSVVRYLMSDGAREPKPTTVARPSGRRLLYVALSSVVVGAALTALVSYAVSVWNPPPGQPPMRFSIAPPPPQQLIVTGVDRTIAISADGQYVVHAAGVPGQSQLVIRPIGQLEGVVLKGTDGARQPFFSPDSRSIAFFSATELKKIAVTGGPTMTLCVIGQSAPRGATWGADDTILFATNSPSDGLMAVSAAGGQPRSLSKPDTARGERDHVLPSALPGGKAALFTILSSNAGNSQVAAIDVTTGAITPLVPGGSHGQFVHPEYLVFAAAGSLRAARFDARRLRLTTEPVPVVEGVLTAPASGASSFSVSETGSLLYVPGSGGDLSHTLVWMDRRGKEEPLPVPLRSYSNPRLSPDGTRIALDLRDQNQDIWVWHFGRQTLERVTFESGAENNPLWTKDSRRLVFNSTRHGGAPNLYAQAADGTGQAERWTTSTNTHIPLWIAEKEQSLLVMEIAPATGPDLLLLQRPAPSKMLPLLQTAFSEGSADVSPDGRWLAYQSNEGGQAQIYVRPFPRVDQGRWQISVGGGTRPVWAANGKEVFYLDTSRSLFAVPIETSPTFSAGQPVKLFDSRAYTGLPGRPYDVSKDGQKFIVVRASEPDSREPAAMIVVLNWIEDLKAKVPRAKR